MDSAFKAAYIISQTACSHAKISEMEQQNLLDDRAGRQPTYQPWQFGQVPYDLGLGHNEVLSYLRS